VSDLNRALTSPTALFPENHRPTEGYGTPCSGNSAQKITDCELTVRPNCRIAPYPLSLQTRRIESVDVLRGINMFWLLGVDGAMYSLAEMTRDRGPLFSRIGNFLGRQFVHKSWEGLHFYDFIFALFVFIVGVSIVLSLPDLVERKGRTKVHLRVVRRSLLLFAMGIGIYSSIGQNWWDVRLLGVLQRIGLCYFFTSLMFLNFNLRGMVCALVTLLVGYWAVMTFIPVPGIGAGSYAPDANLANWIDYNYLPGKLWDITRDPEGMLSTFPAIGTCLFGVFAGLLLRDARISAERKTLWLITGGCALLAAGYLWALQFPIIKAIWTSSFVLVTAGYSAILLGIVHHMVDVWKWQRWATIFTWIGANAITLYILNQTVAERIAGGDLAAPFDRAVADGAGSFFLNILVLLLAIMLARFMYRRRIFLRV
jgi:predicted acyltransferase